MCALVLRSRRADVGGVVEYLPLPDSRRSEALSVLSLLPAGAFVIAAGFEGKRAGVVARSVAIVADEPLMVGISIRRGHWIEPLIRDSRAFSVSVLDSADVLSPRKFADDAHRDDDPFDCIAWETLQSQAPVLRRSLAAIDCEVVRRLDLEADCALIIGRVLDAKVFSGVGGK
ncbi:MAG: flavin reductase [Phycisphaeraceae bacterium]|nr:flavin reductase [Phycisphaeraceae bacterium]